jgi:hypothetical protein
VLSRREYIEKSLRINLFFLRIMKEHANFFQFTFTSPTKDQGWIQQAYVLGYEFSNLLLETTKLSFGNLSPEILSSGEFVTKSTLAAEKDILAHGKAPIDLDLTKLQLDLVGGKYLEKSSISLNSVYTLNDKAIAEINKIIIFKDNLLHQILTCKLITRSYPLIISHALREAILYRDSLIQLQQNVEIESQSETTNQELFWNNNMEEHATLSRALIDPTERQLFNEFTWLANEYEGLLKKYEDKTELCNLLPMLTAESINLTDHIREVNANLTEGLLTCKIKSFISPLLSDHGLRETYHYLRLLEEYTK